MTYKHRTKSGKVRHYRSRQAYLDSVKGMFAQNYQKKNHSKQITKIKSKNRLQHRGGVGKVSSTKKKICETCKRKGVKLHEGKCAICRQEFKKYKDNPTQKLDDLIKKNKIYEDEWKKLYVKKMRQRASWGIDLEFVDEDKLEEALQGYLKTYWEIKKIDPKYFMPENMRNRMQHEVDIKGGREFCSMCRKSNQSLNKGKCKVCREAEKAFAGERRKAEKKQKTQSQDEYIVDRISGGLGDLIKGKRGTWGTRIIFYKNHAYNPINESYVVNRTNPVSYGGQVSLPPYNNDLKEFSIHEYTVLGKNAREEAEKYYNSLI